ncbi:hypothetical protein M2151_001152 [Lachnospiraceae bacterium PH1-22]
MKKLTQRKVLKTVLTVLSVVGIVILVLMLIGSIAEASGLVDDTINEANHYSKYGLLNYQLDYYVDKSGDWLPWNWDDGIGKTVMYGIYVVTNVIWTLSLYLSNATGYIVQEAFKLDFITETVQYVGGNIQTLAGVSKNGLSSEGFYVGFLSLLIAVNGIYCVYTGVIKREVSKAINALLNFVLVFVLSASFIAYAPDYITKLNEFSSDVSQGALSVGTKILSVDDANSNRDSSDLIRDSLFSIQVEQPWLLLQYGTTDIEEIGEERVAELLSVDPVENDGEDREDVVKKEVEDNENMDMSLPKTTTRLGTVFFIIIFNFIITLFVFLLTATMLLSQLLFILYAMFLPISFIISMIPGYQGQVKKAIEKVFNVIFMRAGITIVITIAFSLSHMLYRIAEGKPFFLVAFLQILVFVGTWTQLNSLLGMFSLQSSDTQGSVKSLYGKQRRMMGRGFRQVLRTGTTMFAVDKMLDRRKEEAGNNRKSNSNGEKMTLGERAGRKLGNVSDVGNKTIDKVKQTGDKMKNAPIEARHRVYQAGENVKKNVTDFKGGVSNQRRENQADRQTKRSEYKDNIASKRKELGRDNAPKASEKSAQTKSRERSSTVKRSVNGGSSSASGNYPYQTPTYRTTFNDGSKRSDKGARNVVSRQKGKRDKDR